MPSGEGRSLGSLPQHYRSTPSAPYLTVRLKAVLVVSTWLTWQVRQWWTRRGERPPTPATTPKPNHIGIFDVQPLSKRLAGSRDLVPVHPIIVPVVIACRTARPQIRRLVDGLLLQPVCLPSKRRWCFVPSPHGFPNPILQKRILCGTVLGSKHSAAQQDLLLLAASSRDLLRVRHNLEVHLGTCLTIHRFGSGFLESSQPRAPLSTIFSSYSLIS